MLVPIGIPNLESVVAVEICFDVEELNPAKAAEKAKKLEEQREKMQAEADKKNQETDSKDRFVVDKWDARGCGEGYVIRDTLAPKIIVPAVNE